MVRSAENNLNAWYTREYMRYDNTKPNGPNPETSAATYIDRLKRLPTLIEMRYNDVVQSYLDQYTQKLRPSVSFMLGAQNFYTPIFEEALEAEGLPLELKYLPIVESSLDPTAVSPAGAAGLWQLMIPAARERGLTINSLVDERRDPVRSTQAAAKYLKQLYEEFDDWLLAIAAYNCGAGNVRKAITRAGGARGYWAIYPYLPKETRGYVPAFIAANYVMNYYCDHNIAPMVAVAPIETDTVMISRDLHLQQVADLCNVSTEALMAMNPQYRTGMVPAYGQPMAVRMPERIISYFISLGDTVYNHQADRYHSKRMLLEAAERDIELNQRTEPVAEPVYQAAPAPAAFQSRQRKTESTKADPAPAPARSSRSAKTEEKPAEKKADKASAKAESRNSKKKARDEQETTSKKSRNKRNADKANDDDSNKNSKSRKGKRAKSSEPEEVSVKKG
ncbi:MAG: lytic transglycosylase domain-containing protein, partial [Bacteroidaceae bacterium]|nr:lytic transglycosylase domain-containing protein [Bacteroidaceae bacterium]